jgi:ERF superfamily
MDSIDTLIDSGDQAAFLASCESDFKCSPTTGKLFEALAKAQLGFSPIKKQVENTFYTTERKKAMYADLAAVIAATQKSLAENGLVVIQMPVVSSRAKEAGVVSRMGHSSGEWVENTVLLPATAKVKEYFTDKQGFQWGVKFDAQTAGIGITYARRYSYQSLVGVAAEEDDDANSISTEPTGSSHAAQTVAGERIAEVKSRMANKAPEAASGVPNEVYGLLKAAKLMKRKPPAVGVYLSLTVLDPNDKEIVMSCFDNRKYPDGSSLFGLLQTVVDAGGAPVRFKTQTKGQYINALEPVMINNITFDSDGVPEIQSEDQSA